MRSLFSRFLLPATLLACCVSAEAAAATNAIPEITATGSSAAASVFRMIGALCLVFALFFAGVWGFRNWARLNPARARQRKLQVLEARSLGARQSVVVVGYDKQRFLIGSTPQGMTLLTALPETDEPAPAGAAIVPLPFPDALMQALGRK